MPNRINGSIQKRLFTAGLIFGLAVNLCFAAAAGPLPKQQPAPEATARERKADLKLKVIDNSTKKPIRNTIVEIYSDNGRRCIKAPCPTNGIKWSGRTNARGDLVVPGRVVQRSMTISAAGYGTGKDLVRESTKGPGGRWVIALNADPHTERANP